MTQTDAHIQLYGESARERFYAGTQWTIFGCLEWTGTISPNGYGRLSLKGVLVYAHRLAYFLEHGALPTEPLVVHHVCENKKCVNPQHLQAVTVRENLMASDTVTRRNSQKTACGVCGEPLAGENLVVYKDGRRRCRACILVRRRSPTYLAQIDAWKAANPERCREHARNYRERVRAVRNREQPSC